MTSGLALTNLIVQVALIAGALVAYAFARARRLKRHCLIMRVAIGVQIVLIAALMAPSLGSYLTHWSGWSWFTTMIVIHHTLGAIVVLLFIYFNLRLAGWVPGPRRLRPYMRTALVFWLVCLAMGLYLYWYIWR